MAGSSKNMEWVRSRLFFQTIGPDKINMLRHVLFFKNMQGILDHMDKHARIIAPKFQAVQEILERELGGKDVATWTRPQGGYFVSLDTKPGCAAAVVALAGELGVKFTKAGATWPYGNDPQDPTSASPPPCPRCSRSAPPWKCWRCASSGSALETLHEGSRQDPARLSHIRVGGHVFCPRGKRYDPATKGISRILRAQSTDQQDCTVVCSAGQQLVRELHRRGLQPERAAGRLLGSGECLFFRYEQQPERSGPPESGWS